MIRYSIKYQLPNGKYCVDTHLLAKDIYDGTKKAGDLLERIITQEFRNGISVTDYSNKLSRAKLIIVED